MQNKFQTFGNRQTPSPFFPQAQQQSATPAQPAPASQQPGTLNMSAYQTGSSTQTPFGSMPSLQAYQNQQDAFVQQFLQNQAQYNQGLMAGQQPQRVDLGKTWTQAGDMISQGAYQGNPFATGNVNALMGMFGQYGITPPQGLQDQLISQLGQQSAPPMYSPQPAFDVPRPINPGTGLPSSQPMTGFPTGPGGEYWPGMRMPQQSAPPAPAAPPAPPPPERAPWTPPPPPPGGWRSEQQRRDAEHQSRVLYMMNPDLNQDASPVRQPVVAEPESAAATRPPREVVPNPAGGERVMDSHVAVFPGGRPINFPPGWQIRNIGDVGGNQSREIYAPGVSDEEVAQFIRDNGGQGGPNGVTRRLGGNLAERGQPSSFAPGYGGSINAPPGAPRWTVFQDRDGDMIDDRDQPGPGLPRPGAAQPIPPSQQLPPSGPQTPPADLSQDPGYQQWRQGFYTDMRARTPEELAAREQAFQQQYLNERGLGGAGMPPTATAQPIPPSQQLPPGRMPDWGFPGYTQPGGPAYRPGTQDPWAEEKRQGQFPPGVGFIGFGPKPGEREQAWKDFESKYPTREAYQTEQDQWLGAIRQMREEIERGPNPSDPWSYPLLPGMRRGPSGEQIMTEEARQAEIRRREQETGMRYVKPRAPGQTGSWLPAPKPASQAKDQSAAMAEYIRTQAAPGRARPTPTRTRGTRRR